MLGCIMGDDWRCTDDERDYPEEMARNLSIEFVGGEPAAQLSGSSRRGAIVMKIERWRRRHALALRECCRKAERTPYAVLTCLTELVDTFLQADAPEPPKAQIVTLVRDCQGLSP